MTELNKQVDILLDKRLRTEAAVLLSKAIRQLDHAGLPPQDTQLVHCLARLGYVYLEESDFDHARPVVERSWQLAQSFSNPQTYWFAQVLANRATLYEQDEFYMESEQLRLDVLRRLRLQLGNNHISVAFALKDLALLYSTIGREDEAERLHKESIHIAALVKGKNNLDYAALLHDLAFFYRQTGQLTEAERLYQETVHIEERLLPATHHDFLITRNNLAVLYQEQRKFAETGAILEELLPAFEKQFGKNHYNSTIVLNNLAVSYHLQNKWSLAEEKYTDLLPRAAILYGKQHSTYAFLVGNTALLYSDMQQHDKATALQQEALRITQAIFPQHHPEHLRQLNYAARIAAQKGDFQRALDFVLQSLVVNSKDHQEVSALSAEFIQKLSHTEFYAPIRTTESLDVLLDVITRYYKKNQDPQWLDYHQQVSRVMLEILEHAENAFELEENKFNTLKRSSKTALHGMNASLELYHHHPQSEYIEQSLLFAEHSKAVLLAQAVQSRYAHSFGLPDSVSEQEHSLQLQLAQQQHKLLYAQTDLEQKAAETTYNTLMLDMADFERKLEKNYPRYFDLKYNVPDISIAALRQHIPHDAALIEYVSTDTFQVAFTLTTDHIAYTPLTLQPDSLVHWVKQFRHAASDYDFILQSPDEAFLKYQHYAHQLYRAILQPVLAKLPPSVTRLIIVPDGALGWMPFEALLVSPATQPDYPNLDYLVRHYNISYTYAASLLLESFRRPPSNGKILAFAADYTQPDTGLLRIRTPQDYYLRLAFQSLPSAQQEVKALQERFHGQFFYGDQANESNFKDLAPQGYTALHLATHGFLNRLHPNLSGLALSENRDTTQDNFLYAYEIAHLAIPSDLVVLSACETGFGKLQAGEGVLSLARAFMYAGVPSLVVSMWSVNDVSTQQLMQLFYLHLSDGFTKGQALRQAKLDYLQQASGIAAHPAYWAPFILTGEDATVALTPQRNYTFWYILGVVLLLLFILLWFRFKN